MVKFIKGLNLKVQPAIMENKIRVTGNRSRSSERHALPAGSGLRCAAPVRQSEELSTATTAIKKGSETFSPLPLNIITFSS
jgi:hypothetical protein